jgi:hypothetical protein
VVAITCTSAAPDAQQQAPWPDAPDDRVLSGATSSAPGRLYSIFSPWNSPISSEVTIDRHSAAMVQGLVEAAADGGLLIAVKRYAIPVYEADANTPRQRVRLTARWSPASEIIGVPIPANAAADPASDRHLMVIDRSTGCEYDLWNAVKLSSGGWAAGWANATSIYGTGWYPTALSATGSGTALGGGLITVRDMQAGQINHAIGFMYPATKVGGPVLPATESDGTTTTAAAIPIGARLQLDPGLDLAALGLRPWERTIATALQTYGMYLIDTGGSGVAMRAQHPQSAGGGNPYPWGSGNYIYLPESLLRHMRVLTVGEQYAPRYEITPTPCATWR